MSITFMNAEAARAQIEAMEKIVKGFEALNPGIKVHLEYGVKTEKILISIAGGEPPDEYCGAQLGQGYQNRVAGT